MSEQFTIPKRYYVFHGKPVWEPMDDVDEDKLYGWLCARGHSQEEAREAVEKVDTEGVVEIRIPK